ncbi:seven transmembrane domain protein [Dictyostelium discoideum AX4]|uniref:BOS complex subunit TMEM147 n=1 Tax=Dictyostelium discoideum TaxID=44689 RepID=Q54BM6_DICDI|nr:seven transmembrane domain protein [Dictyostelium discoideum AX4]EAL60664.1 seven transmembrane domain protein [Dictyostelium discoideum AX4]|eukprot:XP_629003.1 seven transmembrane domain protein [Dictyostelium discoideum AX4]
MTFLYFSSCLLITFSPFYIIYKSLKLNEIKSNQLILYGFIGCIFTQFLKMLIIATFLPSFNTTSIGIYPEIIKIICNVIDLFSMSLVLKFAEFSGSKDYRILGIGIGWSFSHAIMSQLIPLLMGTLSISFDFSYYLDSIESNFIAIQQLVVFKLLYLYNKYYNENGKQQQEQKQQQQHEILSPDLVKILLIVFLTMNSILELIQHHFSISHIHFVVIQFLYTLTFFYYSKYKFIK